MKLTKILLQTFVASIIILSTQDLTAYNKKEKIKKIEAQEKTPIKTEIAKVIRYSVVSSKMVASCAAIYKGLQFLENNIKNNDFMPSSLFYSLITLGTGIAFGYWGGTDIYDEIKTSKIKVNYSNK